MHNCRNTHKHTLKQTPEHIHSYTYFHQARTLYDRFKYISSQTRSEVVDVPRAIQMLYMLLLPDGRFHPARYNPPRKKPTDDDISKFVTLQAGPPEMQEANKIQQALTIDPVDPAQVVKGKMLGQGGQGTAFMATYNGVKVCAKYLNGQVTSQVSEENHTMPNCVCVCVCVYTYAHACMNAFIPCIQKCMHATIIGFRMVNHHDVYIPGDQRPSHRSCFNEEIVTSQLPPPCRRTYLAANRHSDCSLQQQFHFRLLHEEGNEWPNIYMPKSILAYASVRKLNHVQGHSSLHTFISFCLRASSSISKRRHGWRSSARVVSGICTISDTCIGT